MKCCTCGKTFPNRPLTIAEKLGDPNCPRDEALAQCDDCQN